MTKTQDYQLDSQIKEFPEPTANSFRDFWQSISTIESGFKTNPIIFQDQKSQAYYVECHILASVADQFLDTDAVLDPEEQVDYRANRSVQDEHRAFLQMMEDAKKGRQFSDLIVEYNLEYKSTKPLKVLGGQHRVIALREALSSGVDNPHGFKCYFALTREQRNEITLISNTNIAIPTDLLDRMQETMLRSGLRKWCQSVGLLNKTQDFADRKNQEGVITVRSARSFIVNFIEGKTIGYNSEALYTPYLCRPSIGGAIDEKYVSLLKGQGAKLWKDAKLIKAGSAFADLHKRQYRAINENQKLKRYGEYKSKAITPVVTAAFALISGALSNKKEKIAKLYGLSKSSKSDPLNAEALSTCKHHTDPETYRGIGARIDKKDLGRMAEVFIQYVENTKPDISKGIVELALKTYHAKLADEDVRKAKSKV